MRLFIVELSRFRSRRAVLLLVLAGVLMAAVLAFQTAWDTRPLTEQDHADARAQAQMQASSSDVAAELTRCQGDPAQYLGPGGSADQCEEAIVASPADFYPRQALDLDNVLGDNGLDLAVILTGLLLIAGATYAGADWTSGSMSNQLLFSPRRTRVWVAKAAAVILSAAVVAAVLLAAFWATMLIVSDVRDLPVRSGLVPDIAWQVIRAVAAVAGAALGGYALTMLFRHTVATLALLFAYAVGGEILISLLPFDGLGKWSVGHNLFGWLQSDFSYYDATLSCGELGNGCNRMVDLGHGQAAVYLGVLLVVAVIASVVAFRRRDLA